MKLKLNFELVPDGCWKSNLRTLISKQAWDYLRKDAKERAGGKCMICGKKTNRLEAHERWSYDEIKGVQKLEDIVAVCKDCHQAIHIERTHLTGDWQRIEDHFMKVNECTYVQMRKLMGEANERQRKLNEVPEWAIDLSFLERYIKD